MKTFLLANVGNHDVYLEDLALLPDDMQGRRLPCRTLGEALRERYAHYAPAIRLPLLGPTLRWLIEHEQVSAQDLHVHLFASDQKRAYTPEGEWLKDTAPFAQVIERYLKDGGLAWRRGGKGKPDPLRLTKKQIRLRYLEGNPADYRNALDFFSRTLSRLANYVKPQDHVYVEVTGGTPAMTSMLVVAAVEVFGQQVQTLYVARGADEPSRVGVSQQLFARHTRRTLCTQVALHAYAVAHNTLDAHGTLVVPDAERRATLRGLLLYADRRLAFDFDRARDALVEAKRHTTGDLQAQLDFWRGQLHSPQAQDLLAELIHSAAIKYQQGDYADFVNRLFRFQEAAFRHLAEQMGIRYRDPQDDEYVDREWVRGVPELSAFLQAYQVGKGRVIDIDLKRSLNRISLGAIVDFYVRDAAWSHRREAAAKIHRLSRLAKLRNKGISGHGFEGVGKTDLDDAFEDDAERIVPHLEEIYQAIFDHPLGDNPYQRINTLCRDLLG